MTWKPKKKITRTEMRAIVDDYHRMLPEWQHPSPETLARADGPLLQGIGFQALSSGNYRPMNSIAVLVAPEPRGRRPDFFVIIPRGRPGSVPLRAHSVWMAQMFETMKREFKPVITERLDAIRLLSACERDAEPTAPQAYALAALNAYFGHEKRARYWCSQYPKILERRRLEWQEWDFQRKAFLDSLEHWLDTGDAKLRLEKTLLEERAKWGLK